MISACASALASIVADQERTERREQRLILPAPTVVLARDLHDALLRLNFESYLVLHPDNADEVSSERRALLPDALTSIREGSFILVLQPGTLSLLQDSIAGSGGAVRAVAFSDEWPWTPATQQEFDFDSVFVERVLEELGIKRTPQEGSQSWHSVATKVIALVKEGLVSTVETRGQHLFDRVLRDPLDPLMSPPERVKHLMWRAGMPSLGAEEFPEQAAGILKEMQDVIERRFLPAISAPELRARVRDRVRSIGDTDDQALAKAADLFLDNLSSSTPERQGVLSIWPALAVTRLQSQEMWNLLDFKMLERLLLDDPTSSGSNVELLAHWDEDAAGGFVSRARTFACYLMPMRPVLNVSIVADAPLDEKVILKVKSGQRTLVTAEMELIDGRCQFSSPVDVHVFGASADAVRVRSLEVSIVVQSDARTQEKVRLRFASVERSSHPRLIVEHDDETTDDISIIGMTPAGEEQAGVRCEPSAILHWLPTKHALEQPRIDGKEASVEQRPDFFPRTVLSNSGISISSGGSLLEVELAEEVFALVLRDERTTSGSPTFQDALISTILHGSRARRSQLLRVFADGASSDSLLGRNGSVGRRGFLRLAAAFEGDGLDAALPVVADLSRGGITEQQVRSVGCVRSLGEISARFDSLRTQSVSSLLSVRALHEYESYLSTRARLQEAVRTAFSRSVLSGWPLYASAPLYSVKDEARGVIDTILTEYLHAYARLQEVVREQAAHENFGRQFVLTHLDSVVHDSDDASERIVLLAPWHPLVVATRFHAQENLVELLEDSMSGSDDSSLASVYSQLCPFRWVPGIVQESTHQPLFCGATEDSGWFVGASTSPGTLSLAQRIVSAQFGVEVRLGLQSAIADIPPFVQRFLRAFPSRRSVSAVADGQFSAQKMVEAVSELLFTADGERTALGRQLQGGVHLRVGSESMPDSVESEWTNPPICVYVGRGEGDTPVRGDLLLLSGQSGPDFEPLAQASQSQGVVRGVGAGCVLTIAPREVVGAQGAVPFSRTYEAAPSSPEEFTAGASGAYARAIAAAQETCGVPRVTRWRLATAEEVDAHWTIVPGHQADPAALLEWTLRSADNPVGTRVLWDYRISLTDGVSSYYVISKVPKHFGALISGAFIRSPQLAEDAIRQLSSIGVAVGNESYKSRTAAVGVVGLVACARVVDGLASAKGAGTRILVMPVDSFMELIGRKQIGAENSDNSLTGVHADLLVITITGIDRNGPLSVRISGVESKYRASALTEAEATEALAQAMATRNRVHRIAARGRQGSTHRWIFAKLVHHGLRLANASVKEQSRIISSLLHGEYELHDSEVPALLVSTEEDRSECTPLRIALQDSAGGWWVRVGPESFPAGAVDQQNELIQGVPPFAGSRNEDGLTAADARVVVASLPQQGPSSPGDVVQADSELTSRGRKKSEEQAGETAPTTVTPKVLIGVVDDGLPAYFDHSQVGTKLANYNIMVTGSSGNGKTQLIKSIVSQLSSTSVPVLMMDFKNDFAGDLPFLERAKISPQWIAFDGLPYNPLIPGPTAHPGTGQQFLDLRQHISGLVDSLREAYSLGAQQASNTLRGALRQAYRDRGIDPGAHLPAGTSVDWPDFNDIAALVEQSDSQAFSRLSPLFDLGIFRTQFRTVPFSDLLDQRLVLDLSQLQSENVRKALAHLTLYCAHRYLNAQPHSPRLRQLIVFDEAHRVLGSSSLEAFSRECRAYGVGLLLSSQNPEDFPSVVKSNLATRILHGNGADASSVAAIRGVAGLADSAAERIAGLGLFNAILVSGREPAKFIRCLGYPHLVVLNELRAREELTLPEIESLPGLHSHLIPKIVEHLSAMNLVRLHAGVVRIVS